MKRRALIFLFVFAMLLPLMIMREFTAANELRYLNIVDNALENGHLFAFYDHGIPYADKPPLYFWVAMLLKSVAGSHCMFLLSFVLSLLPAFVICWIMDRWTEEKLKCAIHGCSYNTAATFMLLSSMLFLIGAVFMRMDMLMTMFILLSLYTFAKMYRNKKGAREAKMRERTHEAREFKRDRLLLPLFVFLAIFSKGAVGFLAPVLCIIVFLISDRDFRIWKYLGWRFWTILILLCAAWWSMVYLDGGKEYLNNLLFHQTIDRGVNSFHHKKSIAYYLISYWWIAAPWCLLNIVLIIKGFTHRYLGGNRAKLMVCSFITIFVMLSLVSSKIAIYLLPALPFVVYSAAQMLPNFEEDRTVKFLIGMVAVIFIILFVSSIFTSILVAKFAPSAALPKLWAPYWVILIPIAIGSVASLLFLKAKRTPCAISVISASLFVTIFLGSLSMKSLNKTLTPKEGCVTALNLALEKGYELASYDLSVASNMDYYFKNDGLSIKRLEKEEVFPLKHTILFLREKRAMKDTDIKNFAEGREKVSTGDGICFLIIDD